MLAALCIFCTVAAFKLHEFVGEPGGLPAVCALIADYLLAGSIALWAKKDAQERGRRMPYDFDSLVFIFWPVAAPVYLFRTRGWRAFGSIGLFTLISIAALLFAVLLGYPHSMESLAR